MPYVTQGQRVPFQIYEEMSAYTFYKIDCLMQRLKPVSEKKYNKWIADLRARAMNKWREIDKRIKPYRCYGFR